jgi:hypothetical protein
MSGVYRSFNSTFQSPGKSVLPKSFGIVFSHGLQEIRCAQTHHAKDADDEIKPAGAAG